MSVKVRRYRRGGWEVDLRVRMPDGTELRERRRAPVSSRSAATRWGEARERLLLRQGPPKPRKEVLTLEEFWPRFMDGHARANRLKPSGIASKDGIGRLHLIPTLGHKRLDTITTEAVQQLKHRLRHRAPKTVNNVLTVLNVLLKKSIEWQVRTSPRRSGTCISVPQRSRGQSVCLTSRDRDESLEIFWRRQELKRRTHLSRTG